MKFYIIGIVTLLCMVFFVDAAEVINWSSELNSGYPASAAFDNIASTRWASQFIAGNPRQEWVIVDLGRDVTISEINLNCETATPVGFTLRIRTAAEGLPDGIVNGDRDSVDYSDWTQIASASGVQSRNNSDLENPGLKFNFYADTTYDLNGTATMTVNDNPAMGRYLIIAITDLWASGASFGCSIYEMAVLFTSEPVTVTYVATDETGDVGAFTGAGWRTSTVSKPHDVDGDNVLGTDGWKWFGYAAAAGSGQANNGTLDKYSTSDADDNTLPSYIESVGSTAWAWRGTSGFAYFNDPLNPGLADKQATYGYSVNDFNITIARESNEAFRLTLFGSAGTAFGGINNQITVTSSGSGSANGTYDIITGERWYMYFDIGQGWDNIIVNFKHLSGDVRGLTGMAFDKIPTTGTVLMIN